MQAKFKSQILLLVGTALQKEAEECPSARDQYLQFFIRGNHTLPSVQGYNPSRPLPRQVVIRGAESLSNSGRKDASSSSSSGRKILVVS